jgi:hypothetical protein
LPDSGGLVSAAEDERGVIADGDGFVEPARLVQGGAKIVHRGALAVAVVGEIRRLPGGQAKTRLPVALVNG